jgi:hypothetical protein
MFKKIAIISLIVLKVTQVTASRWSFTGFMERRRRGFQASMLTDGRIMVISGAINRDGAQNVCEFYDPATGSWTTDTLPLRGGDHKISILLPNGKVLYISRRNLFLYDPFTETWDTSNAELPRGYQKRGPATLLRDGRVLLLYATSPKCALYDCFTDALNTDVPDMIDSHYKGVEVLLLPENKVLVAGSDYQETPWLTELFDPITLTWERVGDLNIGRWYSVAARIPDYNKILIAGGGSFFGPDSLCSELYDIFRKEWEPTDTLNEPERVVPTMVVLPCGKPMIIGGTNFGNTHHKRSCEIFDPAIEEWSFTDSMVVPRSHLTSAMLVTGKAIAIGGWTISEYGGTGGTRYNEIYDPSNPYWMSENNLIRPRKRHTATLLPIRSTTVNCSTNLLIVGGEDANGNILSVCELYNYGENSVKLTDSLDVPRTEHTAILLPPPEKQVIAIGGRNSDGPVEECEIYNVATESWSPTGSMETARFNHTATLLGDGRILVTGGEGASGVLSSCEIYDGGNWTTTSSMATPRTEHTAVLLLDGRVLVIGGRNSSGITNSCEIWDGDSWRAVSSLNNARCLHTAITLQSGKVLVIGGKGLSGALKSCEIWDPITESWEEEGELANARYAHNSVLLYSGLVLTLGGYNGTEFIGESEIWDPGAELDTITFVRNWKSANFFTGRGYHVSVLVPIEKPFVYTLGGEGADGVIGAIDRWDIGLGYKHQWQSRITSHYSVTPISSPMYIEGWLFRGVSEADGGNYCHIASSDHPITTLLRVGGGNWQGNGGGNILYMPLSDDWNHEHTRVYPPTNLGGYYRLWEVVNGIPTLWYRKCAEIEEETRKEELQKLLVFPNPVVNRSIKFRINKGKMVVKIYDAAGRRVYKGEGKGEIRVSNLRSGIYFYCVKLDNSLRKGKFVVF